MGAGGQLLSWLHIKEGDFVTASVLGSTRAPAATLRLRWPGTYRQDESGERGQLARVSVDPLLQLQDGPRLECGVFCGAKETSTA